MNHSNSFPKNNVKEERSATLRESLEALLKGAAIVSTVFYFIGFIVVNTYLGRFGYYSVKLVNIQYFAAGVWAFLPFVIGWILAFSIVTWVQYEARTHDDHVLQKIIGKVKKIGSTVILIFFMGGCCISIYLLQSNYEWIEEGSIIVKMLIFAVSGFFLSGLAFLLFLDIRSMDLKSFFDKSQLPNNIFVLAIIFIALLIYIESFAAKLYGDLPAFLGGGEPRQVQIVVNSNAMEELIGTGIKFLPDQPLSKPLPLLIATEDEYIFLTEKGDSSISIRSDIILAILYE